MIQYSTPMGTRGKPYDRYLRNVGQSMPQKPISRIICGIPQIHTIKFTMINAIMGLKSFHPTDVRAKVMIKKPNDSTSLMEQKTVVRLNVRK